MATFILLLQERKQPLPDTMTVIKALDAVAKALDITLIVVKTPRVSGVGEFVADALSKGDWDRAWELMPKNVDPGVIPVSLLVWLSNPVPDLELGSRILCDMSKYTEVLFLS